MKPSNDEAPVGGGVSCLMSRLVAPGEWLHS
jgi:hypothetical protein